MISIGYPVIHAMLLRICLQYPSIETHGDDWIDLPGHLHRWQSALWHWGGHEAVPIRRGDLGGDDLYRPATAMDGGMVKSQKNADDLGMMG